MWLSCTRHGQGPTTSARSCEPGSGRPPVADGRLSSALEIDANGAALSAVWYDGTSADITAALRPLLAIGSPEVTITEDAWPAVYGDVDKGPDGIDNWKFM